MGLLTGLIVASVIGGVLTLTPPVVRKARQPVLTVVEPVSRARVHLVGVSHGSRASAALVSDTMRLLKPSAVILELCEERFLSVSMEAQLRPRGNATLTGMYDEKMGQARVAAIKANSSEPFIVLSPVEQVIGALRFASGQGLVGGAFAILGLLVGSFQRLTRASSGDEFVTAIREAQTSDIPVLLADAAQNDTLQSVRRVVSVEAINPVEVIAGVQSLCFSALGVGALSSNSRAARGIPPQLARASDWVNIPRVFWEGDGLSASLIPLIVVALFPYLLELGSYLGGDAAVETTRQGGLWEAVSESQMAVSLEDLRERALGLTEALIDAASILFLVRMSRIIGAERDDFMAHNIQRMCRRFPDKDIVVVIGRHVFVIAGNP
jgi:pheromone shutdown protein TraB